MKDNINNNERQFLPRKNPAKTVKGRGFLDRGLMKFLQI